MQPTGIVYLSGIPWAFARHREHEFARGLASYLPSLYVGAPAVRPLKMGLQAAPVQMADRFWTLETYSPLVGYRNSHVVNLGVTRIGTKDTAIIMDEAIRRFGSS